MRITKETPKNDQNTWGFISSVIFLFLTIAAVLILAGTGRPPRYISTFDTILIVLAVFRLTRLFVYDVVFRWARDLFLIRREVQNGDDAVIVREKYPSGIRRNISDLLSCPWCIGVWLSLFVSFAYFLTPYAWFPIFILAIAGFSALIQIIINLVGWRAEQIKGLVEESEVEEEDLDFYNRA